MVLGGAHPEEVGRRRTVAVDGGSADGKGHFAAERALVAVQPGEDPAGSRGIEEGRDGNGGAIRQLAGEREGAAGAGGESGVAAAVGIRDGGHLGDLRRVVAVEGGGRVAAGIPWVLVERHGIAVGVQVGIKVQLPAYAGVRLPVQGHVARAARRNDERAGGAEVHVRGIGIFRPLASEGQGGELPGGRHVEHFARVASAGRDGESKSPLGRG